MKKVKDKNLERNKDLGFQSSHQQALEAIKKLQEGGKIKSVGTNRNYLLALKHIAKHTTGNLRDLTNEQAIQYLVDRSVAVGQKSLNMSRQVMQHLLNKKLAVIKTEKKAIVASRGGYTPEQVKFISEHQNERNALATKLSYSAGLRAHELLTLRLVKEQTPSIRPSDDLKFSQRDGEVYTVVGSGGLVREVLIPNELARQLEQRKLNEPVKVTDRGIDYQQHYNVAGGKNWSASFSKTSSRVLGWSRGGYGLRQTYIQERMKEITKIEYERVLKIVSQEMGHLKPDVKCSYT
jgi:integrase